MLIRPYEVSDVRDYFVGAKQGGGYGQTIDKTGVKCIELIGASFLADEPAIFGTPNVDYIKKEISIKYLDSDFRDSNNMLFIKYRFNGHQISLDDFVIPTKLSKNDTNNSRLEKGVNLKFQSNWRFSISKSENFILVSYRIGN